MCGRFAFYSPREAIVRLFHVDEAPQVEPHYNIAPTQYIAVVRADRDGRRKLSMLHWGLIPWWSKEKSGAAKLINARAETVRDKPSFRDAYRTRRCLILADGYYEWQRTTAVKHCGSSGSRAASQRVNSARNDEPELVNESLD